MLCFTGKKFNAFNKARVQQCKEWALCRQISADRPGGLFWPAWTFFAGPEGAGSLHGVPRVREDSVVIRANGVDEQIEIAWNAIESRPARARCYGWRIHFICKRCGAWRHALFLHQGEWG